MKYDAEKEAEHLAKAWFQTGGLIPVESVLVEGLLDAYRAGLLKASDIALAKANSFGMGTRQSLLSELSTEIRAEAEGK
jgi:hypothetical protein